MGLIKYLMSWICPHISVKETYLDQKYTSYNGTKEEKRTVDYVCKKCDKTVKREVYMKKGWGFEMVREEHY